MDMSSGYAQCSCFTTWKELPSSPRPLSAAQFPVVPQNNIKLNSIGKPWRHMLLPTVAHAQKDFRGDINQGVDSTPSKRNEGSNGAVIEKHAKGSGTTARGRRLLKVREEKRKRDYENLHNYPVWAK